MSLRQQLFSEGRYEKRQKVKYFCLENVGIEKNKQTNHVRKTSGKTG